MGVRESVAQAPRGPVAGPCQHSPVIDRSEVFTPQNIPGFDNLQACCSPDRHVGVRILLTEIPSQLRDRLLFALSALPDCQNRLKDPPQILCGPLEDAKWFTSLKARGQGGVSLERQRP